MFDCEFAQKETRTKPESALRVARTVQFVDARSIPMSHVIKTLAYLLVRQGAQSVTQIPHIGLLHVHEADEPL